MALSGWAGSKQMMANSGPSWAAEKAWVRPIFSCQGYYMPPVWEIESTFENLLTGTSVIRLRGSDRKGMELKSKCFIFPAGRIICIAFPTKTSSAKIDSWRSTKNAARPATGRRGSAGYENTELTLPAEGSAEKVNPSWDFAQISNLNSLPKSIINGRYKILKVLGHGGMGEICLTEFRPRKTADRKTRRSGSALGEKDIVMGTEAYISPEQMRMPRPRMPGKKPALP